MLPIQITFLGTASAIPSNTRNHSSLCVKLENSIWMFDCGEGTQHQLNKSILKISKISKIFITHMHGDHTLGLVGLVCTLLNAMAIETLHIYGPVGLSKFLRSSLSCTESRLAGKYCCFELADEPIPLGEPHPDEIPTGCILPENGTWKVCQQDNYTVYARHIKHTVPCFGYVIVEKDYPGRLNIEKLEPILKQHAPFFKQQGIGNPLSLLSSFKSGTPIHLADSVLYPENFKDSDIPGRKLVILGDTCDPTNISELAMNPTILIHESTNAKLKVDTDDSEQVKLTTISHGHSTPEMAGEFARKINAKMLVLNHFSSRYKGDDSVESVNVMNEIKDLAISQFGNQNVSTATDFMTIYI